MDVLDKLQKIASWVGEQIDRSVNPKKYETKEQREERLLKEEREYQLELAEIKNTRVIRHTGGSEQKRGGKPRKPHSELEEFFGERKPPKQRGRKRKGDGEEDDSYGPSDYLL